jgi:hypothetical protein
MAQDVTPVPARLTEAVSSESVTIGGLVTAQLE